MTTSVRTRSSAVLSFLLAAVLVLLAVPAWALGLGQLQVKSQPGQPLLAEIPIISSDPSELENLQARLASPETFRRVGLEPPGTEVSGLQFAVALDARGAPVIRVTSAAPLQQSLLTFLLEVDWGEGRLVREYSALLDAPRTVSAPVQPVRTPNVAPSNTIVRPPAVAPAPVPAPETATAAEPEQSASEVAATPAPPPAPTPAPAPPPTNAIAPTPAAPPAPVTAAAALSASGDYRVRAGDTLSQIAVGMGDDGHSLAQTMLALLRANPEAFIGDNINMVRQGAVLRMPPGEELSRYSAGEAAEIVRTQIAQWRQASAPQRQPDAIVQGSARTATTARQPAPVATGARLEIVPPSSGSGARAGTRSGIDAGGEGDMQRQELQQTKETLAARDAEVQELKTRVAELEKLGQQQQQLISMKDSELAGAQQNLAKSNDSQATAQQPAEPADAAQDGASWWLFGGLGLLVLALLGWLLVRGRRGTAPAGPRRFDTASLASVMPSSRTAVADDAIEEGEIEEGEIAELDPSDDGFDEADIPLAAEQSDASSPVLEEPALPDPVQPDPSKSEPTQPPHWTAAPALVGTVPTWHGGGMSSPVATTDKDAGDGANDASAEGDSPARQIELARAYLDLGDDTAARTLLREAMDSRDPAARETAARMLRDL